MFTDSHCHLSFPELRAQLPDILQAMSQAQVERALCICTTLEEFEDVYSLAHDHDHLWATVGVHPEMVETIVELAAEQLSPQPSDVVVEGNDATLTFAEGSADADSWLPCSVLKAFLEDGQTVTVVYPDGEALC